MALDLDDTISAWPEWFSWLARALRRDGHRVTILTLRRDRLLAAADLEQLGVEYDVLETLPTAREHDLMAWKAERCRALGVDVLVDDTREIIGRLDRSVLGLLVRDPEAGWSSE